MVFKTRATSGQKFNLWRGSVPHHASRLVQILTLSSLSSPPPHANTKLQPRDSVALVIETSSYCPHTSRHASTLASTQPTQPAAHWHTTSNSRATSQQPQHHHTCTRCPSTLALPPQHGRGTHLNPTDPATSTRSPLPPRYHGSTNAARLDPTPPAPSRHGLHCHHDAGTAIATHCVRLTPPHRRHFDTATTATSDAGMAMATYGAVSTRPPPPDSTHHTGMATAATLPLHCTYPHPTCINSYL
ncbi:hypothetical protein EDB89DRAFT_1904886 [Lactarius sanguifluus]|nr:hypothetical protein EDB89DRAFT_1904886 [Lactarius sanguifluus]